jgi:MYXO-CTERM domain-containing protein
VGNVSAPVSYTWTIDITPPVASITASPANPTNQTTANLSFSSNKAGSTFSCKLDSGAAATCTSPKIYSGLGAGSHTFTVTATDAAGNVSAPASYTWSIDLTPPVVSITAYPASLTNQTTANLSFGSNKAGSTFTCMLDSGAAVACTSSMSFSGLAAGSHAFTVIATDPVGNASSPVSATWTVDTVPPTTTIVSEPSAVTTSTDATFAFASSKAGSTFEWLLDGATSYSALPSNPMVLAGLALGGHHIVVRARDALGNVDASPASYSWSVVPHTLQFIGGGCASGGAGAETMFGLIGLAAFLQRRKAYSAIARRQASRMRCCVITPRA